ncbi:MAG: hypothetical protein IKM31_06070 [Oscillospiraceae bacterium]|nr:hypothetical protein [Oscillospiraceae bacterium]
MRKFLFLLTAAVMAAGLFGSCSRSELNMDVYRYDGYQNIQWGSAPQQVLYQMGMDQSQVDHLAAARLDEDLPEGTFAYEVVDTTMMFGLFTETELYFAEDLYGTGQYTGLYGMRLTFNEIEEWYKKPADAEEGDESWFRLDTQAFIDEYDKRGLYNRVKETGTYEDDRGSWKTVSWSCKSTLRDLPADADTAAIEAAVEAVRAVLGDEAAEELWDAPLSRFTFYYDNDQDHDPYMYYDGFPASILYNIG